VRHEPSLEELQRAWAHCRRPDWPATFEDAMAHPLLSRLVRITALHPPRAIRAVAHAPAPAPQRTEPGRRQPARLHTFDRKRAAAGEREDD
jgi:hypothetical protein